MFMKRYDVFLREVQNYGEAGLKKADFSTNDQQTGTKTGKQVHLVTMFNEYRLQEGKTGLLIKHGIAAGTGYVIVSGLLLLWIYKFEFGVFTLRPSFILYLPFMIGIAGIYVAIHTVISGRKFRMISTDEGLELKRGTAETRIRYSDITRIDILPGKELLIYTTASDNTAALALSSNLTNRDQLDKILQQFTSFNPVNKLPFTYSPWYRHAMSSLFLLVLSLNLITFNPTVNIISGILFLVIVFYYFFMMITFRKAHVNYSSMIVLALLSLLVVFRMVNAVLLSPSY